MKRYSNQQSSSPQRYILSISLLIIINIMFIMATLYIQTYKEFEKRSKVQLNLDKILLKYNLDNIANQEISKKHIKIFFERKKLPSSLKRTNKAVKIKKHDIKKMGWDKKGLSTDSLFTFIPHKNGTIILSIKIENNNFKQIVLKTIFYLIITSIFILFVYKIIIDSYTSRRIYKIDEIANQIINGNIKKRIPIKMQTNDEYKSLSITLNTMLDKIEKLMIDLKHVNNNIAHDLKTPLNRLRSRIEITLLKPRNSKEHQETLIKSIQDIDELLNTFNALLLIGNLESNTRSYQLKRENASELLIEISELYQAIAEEKKHNLNTYIENNIFIKINKTLFSQAISNILENAIKYTPNGGNLNIKLQQRGEKAEITITDNGPGISEINKKLVFKRFYRLNKSNNLSGTGLGMSLVKSILNIHNATIKLYDNNPGLSVKINISAISNNNI